MMNDIEQEGFDAYMQGISCDKNPHSNPEFCFL